jgi:hypothetical protein
MGDPIACPYDKVLQPFPPPRTADYGFAAVHAPAASTAAGRSYCHRLAEQIHFSRTGTSPGGGRDIPPNPGKDAFFFETIAFSGSLFKTVSISGSLDHARCSTVPAGS